jgi:hypothetical protein
MPMDMCGNNHRWSVASAMVLVVTVCLALTSCSLPEHHSGLTSPLSAPTLAVHTPPAAPPPAPAPTTAPGSATPGAGTSLAADFPRLKSTLNGTVGLVISAVGRNPQQLVLGDWTSGPAWSTSKVPLTMTRLREENPPTGLIRAAITESDNAAAESIWEQLGDPVTAAHKIETVVLRPYGDPTTVESQKVHPPYTAFGQTIWALTDQTRFTAAAVCDPGNESIFNLMGQVESGQRWGLGVIPDTRFKGGWGPGTDGKYLVRQLGVLKTPRGSTAVAVATQPASGSFDDGTQQLTEVAKWLNSHIAELPAGQCN